MLQLVSYPSLLPSPLVAQARTRERKEDEDEVMSAFGVCFPAWRQEGESGHTSAHSRGGKEKQC